MEENNYQDKEIKFIEIISCLSFFNNYLFVGIKNEIHIFYYHSEKDNFILFKIIKEHTKNLEYFSINENYLISCSLDNTIKIFDTNNNFNLIITKIAHDITCLDFNNEYLFTGSSNNLIDVYEIKNDLNLIKSIKTHEDIIFLLKIYENLLFSTSLDNSIKVFDWTKNFNLIKTIRDNNYVVNNILLKNSYLITCSWDQTIKIYDKLKFNLLKTLKAHEDIINSIAIQKHILISSSEDKTIKLFDTNNDFKLIKSINTKYSIKYLFGDNNFLIVCEKNKIKFKINELIDLQNSKSFIEKGEENLIKNNLENEEFKIKEEEDLIKNKEVLINNFKPKLFNFKIYNLQNENLKKKEIDEIINENEKLKEYLNETNTEILDLINKKIKLKSKNKDLKLKLENMFCTKDTLEIIENLKEENITIKSEIINLKKNFVNKINFLKNKNKLLTDEMNSNENYKNILKENNEDLKKEEEIELSKREINDSNNFDYYDLKIKNIKEEIRLKEQMYN